jgi:2,3-bisphosphoglycerate-dependent phosphoglycerate mutase
LTATELPLVESLKDTLARFLPYRHDTRAPAVRSNKRVLVAAHGNSIRAMVAYLDNDCDEEIVGVNIPTGVPPVYEWGADLRPLRHYYLGDAEEVARAAQRVADQAKRRP